MMDSHFRYTVILLAEHSKSAGALGFILNRPTGKTIGDIAASARLPRELHQVALFEGGPVQAQSITFAALKPQKGSVFYKTQISAEEAIELSKTPGTLIRSFVGRASWEPLQLESELERSSWFQCSCPSALLQEVHDQTLWSKILRGISPWHALASMAPPFPFLN